jgi:phosphate transport system substrate-binding protein
MREKVGGPPPCGAGWHALRAAFLLSWTILLPVLPARAGEVIVQGSTTVATRLITPNLRAIETASGQRLTVIPNKSNLGLIALFEHRANLAMISTSLANEVALLKKEEYPPRDFSQLRAVPVGNVRVAFAVNPQNRVRHVTLAEVAGVLEGRIANWQQLGGATLPIRVVAVREGGGVLTAVEAQLLDHRPPSCDMVWVHLATQVIKTVAAEPGALGIAQLGLLGSADAVELTTDDRIMQELNLVTLGEPTQPALQVIDAVRRIGAQF